MKLKKYTQKMFDAIPIVNCIKNCPFGDYSDIKIFQSNCVFAGECRFGNDSMFGIMCKFGPLCSFGLYCKFDDNCEFENACMFGHESAFGKYCFFGDDCSFLGNCNFLEYCSFSYSSMFGRQCWFSDCCIFGEDCSFGDYSTFGKSCVCEFGEFDNMVSCCRFGSAERTTYFFHLINGDIFVRCGCFSGSLNEWEEQVKETHKGTHLGTAYLLLIPAIKEQFLNN